MRIDHHLPAFVSDVIIVVKIGLSAKRGLCHDKQVGRGKCGIGYSKRTVMEICS